MNYNKVVIKNNLKVIGKFTLVHEDGREEEIDGKRSFCRCGLSSAMPFCDNTHQSKLKWVKKVTDWKDDLREIRNKSVEWVKRKDDLREIRNKNVKGK